MFRKLEQNLAAFAAAKEQMRARMGASADSAVAGASIVGRYEDGRPAGLRDRLPSILPVENGFVYNTDPPVCPIGSHVRIVNPRTARDRSRMIAWRGIPYGTRPNGPPWAPATTLQDGGVGLLFMAYMADVGAQFEAIQITANGSHDPLIGQGGGPIGTTGAGYGEPLVRLRGGDYFFVPSPAFFGLASNERATISNDDRRPLRATTPWP